MEISPESGPLPICPKPLFQSEAFILMQIKLIFIRKLRFALSFVLKVRVYATQK